MEKRQSAITDEEWIRYKWVDVTGMCDPERKFLQVRENTPEEAAKAAREIANLRPPEDPVSQIGL
jgi:hypothetical protein